MGESRLAAVGAFVIVGVLLFGIGLFLIGDRRLLFVENYEIYTEFSKVTGVAVGTGVRVAGLSAGEVTEVVVPPGPSARFRVRMRIREDLRQLVRTDSIATIQTDGIVGNAFIQIGGGTEAQPVAPDESTIPGRDPIEFADLIEEGRDTFRTVTKEILTLRGEISEAVGVLTVTLKDANALILEVGADAKVIAARTKTVADDVGAIAADARTTMRDIKAGEGTLGKFLVKDDLWNSAKSMSADAEKTLANIREASAKLRETVDRLQAPGGPTNQLIADLGEAMGNAREVMADLAENSEALKQHWLFRGFYRNRGYFDLDSMTLDQYRRGAVEKDDRAPLRIWLEAKNLFETNDRGEIRLSDEGRRRLDVAMADFLEFPRNSPLVVEGYATTAAPAERYLQSDTRARIVQDYLQGRFRRGTQLVGSIPIGLSAEGSPTGDGRWDGIALTLFVKKDLLARARTAS